MSTIASAKEIRPAFVAVVVFSAFSHVLNLASPLFIMHVYDRVLSTRSGTTLVLLAAIFSLLLIVAGILDFVRGRVLVRLANCIELTVIPRLADRFFGRTAVMGPQDLPQEDLQALRVAATGVPGGALLDAPWSVLYIVLAFLLHSTLGWTAIACAALLGLLVFVAQRQHAAGQVQLREAHTQGIALIRDYGANADLARSLGVQTELAARWERQRLAETAAVSRSSDSSASITSASKTLRLLVQIAILAVAAWLAIRQELTAGAIFASSIIVSRALMPLEVLASSWGIFARGHAAYRKLTAASPARPESTRVDLSGAVEELAATGLYVAVPGTLRPFLKEITVGVRRGELLVLAGPVACGKTLLCRTLAGAVPLAAGSLRINGLDSAALDPVKFARRVGFLPQAAEFFPATIAENLARLDSTFDASAVVDAVRSVGMHETVAGLPFGYDTSLHAGGLSAGQLQLLSIARAFCGEPSLLILDTPETSLDPDSLARVEALLQEALARGALIVLVTHHPRLMRFATKVVIMAEGRLVRAMSADEFFRRTSGLAADVHSIGKRD